MKEPNFIIALILTFLTGAFMAFGLVLVFVFLGSDDIVCHSALYSLISTIL